LTSATYAASLTSTATGHLLLSYGAVSLVLGTLMLRRMAHIEV
jgi:Flp pilus assembly protein TadB